MIKNVKKLQYSSTIPSFQFNNSGNNHYNLFGITGKDNHISHTS